MFSQPVFQYKHRSKSYSVVVAVGGCVFTDADAVQILEPKWWFSTIENCNSLSVFSSSKGITSDQNARDVFLPVESNLYLPVDEFFLFWLCIRYFCTHGQLGMWIPASHSRTKTAMHGIVLCALLFFYNFLCDKLLNRCRATWNLFDN